MKFLSANFVEIELVLSNLDHFFFYLLLHIFLLPSFCLFFQNFFFVGFGQIDPERFIVHHCTPHIIGSDFRICSVFRVIVISICFSLRLRTIQFLLRLFLIMVTEIIFGLHEDFFLQVFQLSVICDNVEFRD